MLPRPIVVHRAPRKWPYLAPDPIVIETAQPPNRPPLTTLIISIASLLGLVVSGFIYSRASAGGSGTLILGFLAISGVTMIGSLITFVVQRRTARRDSAALAQRWAERLDERGKELALAAATEAETRQANDPPLDALASVLAQRPDIVWQRRPSDPDFLRVRVATGDVTPAFSVRMAEQSNTVTLPPRDPVFGKLQEHARQLVESYQKLPNLPITVPLRELHATAFLSNMTTTAEGTAMAMAATAQIALHHSPKDVWIFVFAPRQAPSPWQWVSGLPHHPPHLSCLAIHPDEHARTQKLLLDELIYREQTLDERSHSTGAAREIPLPQLVIVVDAFTDALKTPALALALRRGTELGASVLSVHTALAVAPEEATLAISYGRKVIAPLGPVAAPLVTCGVMDQPGAHVYQQMEAALRQLAPEESPGLELPREVSLLALLSPPIDRPDQYTIEDVWKATRAEATKAGARENVSIPLGQKLGPEAVSLELVKDGVMRDGPHGLLIGQTGSGKSELLRSIIAALAIKYPPDMVNFVLVDYKGGLALDAFEHLPHTVAFLTNMTQAGQTNRFLKMLEAELVRRQQLHDQGKAAPRLFVIIDEFAEMVNKRSVSDNADAIIDNLLSIVRLGRELGVHLLFASQRPEGSVIQRLRGYVQYRVCLRTNTDDDSREVLGRTDAARLPADTPGRGYLLRGDSQLTLFQAARVALPARGASAPMAGQPRTVDEVIAARMRMLRVQPAVQRWPESLPVPTPQTPTPLILNISGPAKRVVDAWNTPGRAPLREDMTVPLGYFDRPSEQTTGWFIADLLGHSGPLSGGPLLVMGDLNAGKTTTMQTLLLYLATQNPNRVRWYVLDPSGSLGMFGQLKHARDWLEPDMVNVCEGTDAAELTAFQGRIERAVQTDPATRPALLLVIDDYDDLGSRHSKKLHDFIQQKIIKARDRRIYLALTAARQSFDGLPPAVVNGMATRIVLYMSDRDSMRAALGGRLPFTPEPLPGRGFVQTRRSVDEIQIASPVYGVNDAERLGNLQAVLEKYKTAWP